MDCGIYRVERIYLTRINLRNMYMINNFKKVKEILNRQ